MVAYIQPPADSNGKKIELDKVQNADGIDTYLQRFRAVGEVHASGEEVDAILLEMKLMNFLLGRILQALVPTNSPINLNDLRNEIKMFQALG